MATAIWRWSFERGRAGTPGLATAIRRRSLAAQARQDKRRCPRLLAGHGSRDLFGLVRAVAASAFAMSPSADAFTFLSVMELAMRSARCGSVIARCGPQHPQGTSGSSNAG